MPSINDPAARQHRTPNAMLTEARNVDHKGRAVENGGPMEAVARWAAKESADAAKLRLRDQLMRRAGTSIWDAEKEVDDIAAETYANVSAKYTMESDRLNAVAKVLEVVSRVGSSKPARPATVLHPPAPERRTPAAEAAAEKPARETPAQSERERLIRRAESRRQRVVVTSTNGIQASQK